MPSLVPEIPPYVSTTNVLSDGSHRAADGPIGVSGTGVGTRVGPFSTARPQVPVAVSGIPGWQGINGSRSECSCAPPDASVAVGPMDVVELTNLEEMVWSKTGAFVLNQSLFALFDTPPSAAISAPRIVYDNSSERWYTTISDMSSKSVLLLASTSANPLNSWYFYSIPAWPNEVPTLPSLGASQWMVGVAANDVNATYGNITGTGYTLLNRTDLSTGTLWYYNYNPAYQYADGLAESALTSSSLLWFGGLNLAAGSVFWVNFSGAPPAVPE